MAPSSKKITIEELNRRIADPTVPERDLAPYFLSDEARSGTFNPALKFNPATVALPTQQEMRDRGDVVLAGANGWARLRRRWAFEARIASGYKGPVIVSEGDSWFQYPLKLEDVIDHLMGRYAVRSLDAAGDTLQNMFNEKEYLPAIQETRASVFLFSGGGNDVLGGGNLKEHLRDFDPALKPADHLLPSYREVLDHAISLYDRIFRSVEDGPGDVLTICHGYDRPVPNSGKWLGRPMEERGITDRAFQKRITDRMVDSFNARLKLLADAFPHVTYLDLRDVVGADPSRWDDELHPTSKAFGDVADRFNAVIQASAAQRSVAEAGSGKPASRGTSRRKDGAKASSGTAAARDLAAPAVARVRRRGLSLHVGLNSIDPGHYGTDGALNACEFDAEDMAGVAKAAGFDVVGRLTSPAGTRDAVMQGIEDAAKALKPGDIFLLTYAGHGSQAPDFNRDEEDGADETWCLFDGMLIDDELYDLWRRFAENVRVLVVSDSCHSGSVIRATGFEHVPDSVDAPKARQLPMPVAARTLRSNRAFYREIFEKTRLMNEGLLVKELALPLKCSVLLLSGCMDNQVSRDGVTNGRFTQELLAVWREGLFKGDYGSFHKAIRRRMPENQSPDLMTAGRPNLTFMGQKPFSI